MNMIPFHHVTKPNYLVIQFDSYKNILMLENYCSDPDCDCDEVLINFAQLNKENKITNNLLNIRIDLNNGKILEKTVLEPSIDADAIVKEFQNHFYQFKDHLNENNKKIKNHFSQYHELFLPNEVKDLISTNNCVNYHKLFDSINQININFNNENYIIEDQYCMNPTCTCNEVIIVVYEPNAKTSNLVFRLDINNNQYEILKHNNLKNHIDLIDYIINHKKEKLKARYNRMKKIGKQFT